MSGGTNGVGRPTFGMIDFGTPEQASASDPPVESKDNPPVMDGGPEAGNSTPGVFARAAAWLSELAGSTTTAEKGLTKANLKQGREEMSQALDAARPGGITGTELEAAEKRVAGKFGTEVACQVLFEALCDHNGQLTADAKQWLERRSVSAEEQVAQMQAIVRTYLAGAHLIDVNRDGKVGVEDLLWTRDASGKINTQRLSKTLVDRVRVDAAVVHACSLMARAGHEYAVTSQIKVSPTYWVCTLQKGFFRVAEGVRPSAAVNDIFENPKRYRFPSNVATTIVYLKAMLDLLGPNDFDRVAPGLMMGPWSPTDFVLEMAKISGSSRYAADEKFRADIRAGDEAYFLNPSASPEAKRTRGAAQNAIYLGDGKWYAHPFGITTEKAIRDYLNSTSVPGVGDKAHLTQMQTRMQTELLREDKDPK